MSAIRHAPFALRIVQRRGGRAAIVYRRQMGADGRARLRRLAALAPLAFTAGRTLLHEAVAHSADASGQPSTRGVELLPGPFYPLAEDWGVRVACFALLAAGLRDGERLARAAAHVRAADANEAAWWLGLLTRSDNARALRALRILTEATQ